LNQLQIVLHSERKYIVPGIGIQFLEYLGIQAVDRMQKATEKKKSGDI
jgi:hypothetical protein